MTPCFDHICASLRYGAKSEGAGAVLMVVNSTNFASYGHGGAANTKDDPSAPLPPFECNGMSPCPWLPGLYRIINSDNVRLVNVMGQWPRATSVSVYDECVAGAAGGGGSGKKNVSRSEQGQWPSIWFRTPS